MTRYADPRRCPDCHGPIEYDAQSCPGCGLLLRHPLAGELYRSLMTADRQLEELRVLSTATALADVASDSAPDSAPLAAPASPVASSPAPRMTAASVPKVLLTLGAGCVLVAALVFLAVTWSVLGVAGRTTVLMTLTIAAALTTWWLLRRQLHGTAEATSLIGFGLLALDVAGAKHSGWLGGIDRGGFLVLLGTFLLAVATGTTLVTRRTSSRGLLGTEAVTVAAAAVTALGLSAVIPGPNELGELAVVLVLASLTAAHHRLGLRWACYGLAGEALLGWLVLTASSAARAAEHDTFRALWIGGDAWPLLSAAALAAALAWLRTQPPELRVGGVAVGVLLVTGLVLLPANDAGSTRELLALIVALVVLSGTTLFLKGVWRFAPALAQVVVGSLAGFGLLTTVAVSVARLLASAHLLWAGGIGNHLPVASPAAPAGWLLPVGVCAFLAAASSLARPRRTAPAAVIGTGMGAPMALALTLAAYPVPVWTVEATLAIGAVTGLAIWLSRTREMALAPAAGYLVAAVGVGLHSPWLTTVALLLAFALAAVVGTRTRIAGTATVTGLGLGWVVGGTVWSLGRCLDAAQSWTALAGLLALGLLLLTSPTLPGPRRGYLRLGIEAGAAAAAVPLAIAGIAAAPPAMGATWAAVYLTVGGGFITISSLVRPDRRQAGWLGGVVLATASWVRLWDVGVHAPEAYTLPSAAALLIVGWVRMRRRKDTDTMSSLAPGLGLALVPSLIWALAQPTGWRPLLLGLGCLGLVLAGAWTRWTAPILFGAAVGAMVVLRLAAPYIDDAVPRWVLLGTAGGVLLGIGATWEQRLQEARSLMSYVRALR